MDENFVKVHTLQETAKLLGVSAGTIHNEMRRGRLQCMRFGVAGKAVRFRGPDIAAFMEASIAPVDTAQSSNAPSTAAK